MSITRELAEFLTGTALTDLPPQAVDHAAMLIASTLASAALGSAGFNLRSSSATSRENAAGSPKPRCGSMRGRNCR